MLKPRGRAGLILLAPAKLNLTLEVLGKREDGFHEVRSVLQAISLWDSLTMETRPQGIEFHCSVASLQNTDNLAHRAAKRLLESTGVAQGASIRLEKHIPESAGLGGGSSDAAAVLRGLDWLWETNVGMSKLAGIAGQLSSDAPFFLVGGAAVAEGRGEVLTRLPPLPAYWAIVLRPDVAIPCPKTARMYALLGPRHYSSGERSLRLVAALTNRASANICESLYNVFEAVAFDAYPGLSDYWVRFHKAGAPWVHLAGSGPALFTLTADREAAAAIHDSLKKDGLDAYLASTRN